MVGADDSGEFAGRLLSREQIERMEAARLAPYAGAAARSRGRREDEPGDPYRTAYQRDRDRIVHSRAFRRLLGKTQVFVSDTGDHYRVRLTHSLEVGQIARSLSRVLRLNEDLTEALALAHDLGHPPFGHSGGDVLDRLMADHGGFEHNRQSLRIVDRLERRSGSGRGLNLTYEVRESIIKHKRPFSGPDYEPYRPEEAPLLEAQIVDHADGIAYNAHDLDDGLRSGVLEEDEVRELGAWQAARDAIGSGLDGLDRHSGRTRIIARLINLLVRDLLAATAARLDERNIQDLGDVREARDPLVGFSAGVHAMERELRRFLYERFYTHHRVARMRHRGEVVISGLFSAIRKNPRLMPGGFRELAEEDGLERAICDYIAGMTDRYAQREHALLFHSDPGTRQP